MYSGISPFPTNISGILSVIVDNNRFFIESYTGTAVGSVIPENMQSPLINLSTANVLRLMAVQDMGVKTVSIGDLSVNNENLITMAQQFETLGREELKIISKSVKFYRSRG